MSEQPNATPAKPVRSPLQKALKALSILSIVGGILSILMSVFLFLGAGFVATTLSPQELADGLGVSEKDALIFMFLGFGLVLLNGILSLLRGIRGLSAIKSRRALQSYTALSQMLVALDGVEIVWNLSQGSYMDPFNMLMSFVGLLIQGLFVYVGMKLFREDATTEQTHEVEEARDFFKARRKLGFIRLIQVSYALNIIFSFAALTFMTRDEMVYSYLTVIDWINITLDVVCFYLIWKRLRVAKNAIIILSVVNMVLNTINHFVFHNTDAGIWMVLMIVDAFVIIYFINSKRPKEALVNELSYERRIDVNEGDFIAKKGWPRWRNLLLYYCVFSVLGHWMELGFCMLIRAGIVAGEYDPTNTMLWRDLLFPFAMEGIAVVICALWLYPLKNWLIDKIKVRFVPLFVSFVINGAVCTLMELIGGLLVNADHSLWDYSDMFCNFMGQICLQNAIGFGLACTLIVWIVYPTMERGIAHIPSDVMNLIFVGAFTFCMILQILYLVEPAEIANAFNTLGFMLSSMGTGV